MVIKTKTIVILLSHLSLENKPIFPVASMGRDLQITLHLRVSIIDGLPYVYHENNKRFLQKQSLPV